MSFDYLDLYQDIGDSSGGDMTGVSAGPVGNTNIASAQPGYKPYAYRSGKPPKGGKKTKKATRAILKPGTGRGPDDPEYRGPAQ